MLIFTKNSKHFQCTLFALILSCNAFSQGISNWWLMGYESFAGQPWGISKLNFANGTCQISYDSLEMEFHNTVGEISDSNGDLLFYTNGYYIADATNDTMLNGSNIHPGLYADTHQDGLNVPQGCLILKKPGSNSLYYLFHSSCDTGPAYCVSTHLNISVIDMNNNNGLGSVVIKNYPMITDSLNQGKISACRHANGRDWWILCHRYNTNMFYKMLFTPFGLPQIQTQNVGMIRPPDVGETKFSPDGNFYAYFYPIHGLEIFSFDRCTGMLNLICTDSFQFFGALVGVEFSPNSKYLYVTNATEIYQYDVSNSNILSTKTLVAQYDSFVDPNSGFGTYLCNPQLANDGKIYISTGNSTAYLHKINSPDSAGVDCDLQQHAVLLPSLNLNSMPNYPNYFLGALTGSACDTIVGVGIEEYPPEIRVKVFPNPANENIGFSFPAQNETGHLEIFDVLGNVLFTEPIAPWSQYKLVEVSHFQDGMYFCQLKLKGRSTVVKFLKQE